MGYNHFYHSFLKMSTIDTSKLENFKLIQRKNINLVSKIKKRKKRPNLKIGDWVRTSFDRKSEIKRCSYNLHNSYAKYEIYNIQEANTIHPKYFLKHIHSDQKFQLGIFFSGI